MKFMVVCLVVVLLGAILTESRPNKLREKRQADSADSADSSSNQSEYSYEYYDEAYNYNHGKESNPESDSASVEELHAEDSPSMLLLDQQSPLLGAAPVNENEDSGQISEIAIPQADLSPYFHEP